MTIKNPDGREVSDGAMGPSGLTGDALKCQPSRLEGETTRPAGVASSPSGVPSREELASMLLDMWQLGNTPLEIVNQLLAHTFTVAQAASHPSKEQIAAQVLLAMSDKVGSDDYGVSYALKINKGRAEKAAESILSMLAAQPPAAPVETKPTIKGQIVEGAVIDIETMEPLGGMLDRVLRDVEV